MFVRGAITGVAYEGIIAAVLTSVMILLFLGSWRSTVIIAMSIPLSVLGAIVMLSAIGETLNIMTLGGLALAVGILVDDATVTIENINWHLEQGKEVETAIMDGANQIVTPAFVSLLCICIVFVPMFFLRGRGAVPVRADGGSGDVRDGRVVPVVAHAGADDGEIPAEEARQPRRDRQASPPQSTGGVPAGFRGDLHAPALELQLAAGAARMARRPIFVIGFLAFVGASFALVPYLGRNFFPSVDAGQILMHVRAQVGTRIEESANQFAEVQKAIRKIIPPHEIETLVDNIGMPISGINLTYNNTGVIGPQDGDIQIKLKEGHRPTGDYVKMLREQLPQQFPGVSFSFLPADIVSQILNFGAPAPIDLQIRGANLAENFAYARQAARQDQAHSRRRRRRAFSSRRTVPRSTSTSTAPARNMSASPSATSPTAWWSISPARRQVAPTYYLNPDNGVSYSVVMQTPQYQIDSLGALQTLPITTASAAAPPILGGIAEIKRVDRQRRGVAIRHPVAGADLRHDAGPRPRRGGGRHPKTDRRHQGRGAEGHVRWCCWVRCRP